MSFRTAATARPAPRKNKLPVLGLIKTLLGVSIPICAAMASAQSQTINVQLVPAVSITVPGTVTLSKAGMTFGSFSSPAVTLRFKIRNTQSSGSGSVTVQATSEFAPGNGPRSANGDFTYTCSAASVGSACVGTQTVSTTTTTAVVTAIPAGTCTGTGCGGSNPQSVQLNFTLANRPQFKTGTYSATLTFTISAT